jgi:hypothetical protein
MNTHRPLPGCRMMPEPGNLDRRAFLRLGGALGAGLMLAGHPARAQEAKPAAPPSPPRTNIDEALKVPRTPLSLPGFFPGTVVEAHDPSVMKDDKPDPVLVKFLFHRGLTRLTGKNSQESFNLFFSKNDVVGLKVNPVGPGLISTRPELVKAVVDWLETGGIPRWNIIIWDRFDYMLRDAGFTPERFPGIGIEGLQTMDEAAAAGETKDNSRWLSKNGHHLSEDNFDRGVYYWADVKAPQDPAYLNQHVFNGKFSYFGKLLTKKLTKIINLPVFKNTGNGISMATKNIGYGAICNTNRLHRPLFFNVNTEVHAFPVIRDKLVLNITDGLRAQYDGGPGAEAKFIYSLATLFLATDPFALDMVCHTLLVEKRKSMGVRVDEHPMYTEYLRYAQRLGLGRVDRDGMRHVRL